MSKKDLQPEEEKLLGEDHTTIQPRDAKQKDTANWRDIILMIFINFLSFVCFAIVLPSLWPFLDSLGANKSYVGWAVAINSFGTFIASPFLGKWADKRGVKEVIFASLVAMIGGNIMYSLSQDLWMLLGSRFIVGVAAANYAPASAYLSYATHPKDRTLVMTLNSAASILGFILGPAFATVLTFIDFHIWKFKFDDLTSPGYASVILSLVCILFLPTFKDIPPEPTDSSPQPNDVEDVDPTIQAGEVEGAAVVIEDSSEDEAYIPPDGIPPSLAAVTRGIGDHNSGPFTSATSKDSFRSLKALAEGAPTLPLLTISVCLFLQFVFYTAFTVFETIGTPYTQNAYGWSVFDNGLLFAGIGFLCILALVILQLFARVFRDRALLLGCEIIMTAGFAILVNYPFSKYVELPRFIVGVSLSSAGFSAACALLISIFSKVLGNVEQGLLMGWLSSSGSIARTIGPIGASYLLEYVGGGSVFIGVGALLLVSGIVTLLYWQRLKTKGLSDYTREKVKEAAKKKWKERQSKKRGKSGLGSSSHSYKKRVHNGNGGTLSTTSSMKADNGS